MATRCCCPPESCDGDASATSDRPTASSSSPRRRRAAPAAGRAAALAGEQHRQLDVLGHGEVLDQVEELEHVTDPSTPQQRTRGLAEPADVLAVHRHGAGIRAVQAAEQVQQRRLAAAARAHDGDPLTGGDVQVDAAHRVRLPDTTPEGPPHTSTEDARIGHGQPPRRGPMPA
jgi:hypothetical protein